MGRAGTLTVRTRLKSAGSTADIKGCRAHHAKPGASGRLAPPTCRKTSLAADMLPTSARMQPTPLAAEMQPAPWEAEKLKIND